MKELARFAQNTLPPWAKTMIKKAARAGLSAVPGQLGIEAIGLKFGTDKLAHGYLPHYDAHFAPLRGQPIKLLEIGIGGYHDPKDGGTSLRLWQDYFAHGQIYGLDIHEKSHHDSARIKTFQGSQADPAVLDRVMAEIGTPDIIIDDGSHINEHMIASFQMLFPRLKNGGIYAIEDINTSYVPSYGGSFDDLNSTATAMGMVKTLLDSLHHQCIPKRERSPFDGHIVSVHAYPKLVFIMKGVNDDRLSRDEQHFTHGAA